jgi:hypothetical protein
LKFLKPSKDILSSQTSTTMHRPTTIKPFHPVYFTKDNAVNKIWPESFKRIGLSAS